LLKAVDKAGPVGARTRWWEAAKVWGRVAPGTLAGSPVKAQGLGWPAAVNGKGKGHAVPAMRPRCPARAWPRDRVPDVDLEAEWAHGAACRSSKLLRPAARRW
jgi:hypothetical protein